MALDSLCGINPSTDLVVEAATVYPAAGCFTVICMLFSFAVLLLRGTVVFFMPGTPASASIRALYKFT
jgi:hypothetical protein